MRWFFSARLDWFVDFGRNHDNNKMNETINGPGVPCCGTRLRMPGHRFCTIFERFPSGFEMIPASWPWWTQPPRFKSWGNDRKPQSSGCNLKSCCMFELWQTIERCLLTYSYLSFQLLAVFEVSMLQMALNLASQKFFQISQFFLFQTYFYFLSTIKCNKKDFGS